MFKRKIQYDVVPEGAYTDFSERYEERTTPKNGTLLVAATAATASLATYAITTYSNPTIPIAAINPTSIPPILEPLNVLAQAPTIPVSMSMAPEVIQTGIIADTSLELLANVLDPLVSIMMAVSFPIASVIMIGSCFYFMFGNPEKAWGNIMMSALGYIVIQCSPLFLSILRNVGESVVPA